MLRTLLLLLLIFVNSCKDPIKDTYDYDCGTDAEDFYSLSYNYFELGEKLNFSIRVVVLDTITTNEIIDYRVKELNNFFDTLDIRFYLSEVVRYKSPMTDSTALKAINTLEAHYKKPQKNLYQYHIVDLDTWNKVYEDNNHITIYIYPDEAVGPPGAAGGIPSNYLAIKSRAFMFTVYRTLEHEMLHCFGLLHTHSVDESKTGLNNKTGDRVCDTYKSTPELYKMLDKACEPQEQLREYIPEEYQKSLIENVMSYTKHDCRTGVTEVQRMRMLNTIEVSSELKKTMITNFRGKEDRPWEVLEKYR